MIIEFITCDSCMAEIEPGWLGAPLKLQAGSDFGPEFKDVFADFCSPACLINYANTLTKATA